MIRLVDIVIALIMIIITAPLIGILLPLLWLETGSPFFVQQRVGQHQKLFNLIKLRSMKLNTASLGTHEVNNSQVTRVGKFIRKFKIDEFPQFLNVLKGEMSVVGPRPCLPIQHEVIEERNRLQVLSVKPGITGLAQIQGVDMSDPSNLAIIDSRMIRDFNIKTYLELFFLTFIGRGRGDKVSS